MNPTLSTPVSVRDLTKKFGDFTAVNGVSFSVREGEIFGFLGPNGAGKSTTIKMICGLYVPTSGEGRVAGFDIMSEQQQIKQHIGYMSQAFSLYDDLTVEENIDFYARVYNIPRSERADRKLQTLETANLDEQRTRPTSSLPRGWKQRLALACAIMHRPTILFLDEPTSGVDPRTRRRFWDLIYDLSDRGMTVFVTTHYMEEAEYCGRLGLISKGNLIALGTPEELKNRDMPLHVLEVACESPQEALIRVESLGEVREAALFGMNLHVVVEDPEAAQRAITETLRRENIAVSDLQEVPPSMEDVFVYLVQAKTPSRKNRGEGE